MDLFKVVLYSVSALTCLACMVLLVRQYLRHRVRLLLWTALCFGGLTLNNALVFFDLVLCPSCDLRIARLVASLAGMLFLLYGFIWDAES